MYMFNLVLVAHLILGYTFSGVNAGLLDSLGGTIGLGISTNRPRYPATNHNNNNRPNQDYYSNDNKEPLYDEVVNSNDYPINEDRRFYETTTKRAVPNRGSLELTEKEKIAMQKYPELTNLLDKLKEMNKQKELEKQKNQNKPINGGSISNNNNKPSNTGTNNQNNLNKPSNNGGQTVIQKPDKVVRDKNGWVQLKKRKIFFKAKPVRPENEMVSTEKEEVIYYLD